MSDNKFSVCQFFEDDTYEYVRRNVSVEEAVEAALHYRRQCRGEGRLRSSRHHHRRRRQHLLRMATWQRSNLRMSEIIRARELLQQALDDPSIPAKPRRLIVKALALMYRETPVRIAPKQYRKIDAAHAPPHPPTRHDRHDHAGNRRRRRPPLERAR